MAENYWYYVKDDKQQGPVPESNIREMFDARVLGPETLVWSESMTEWAPASTVESFRVKTIPSPPPLPQKAPPIPSPEAAKRVPVKTVSQVRPWVRFWARYFDYYLFFFFLFFPVYVVIDPSALGRYEFCVVFVVFFWAFVEAFLLSTWGTTPGKWLLKTTLRDSEGKKLTFFRALKRSFSVWWRGMGIGVPGVTLITGSVAFHRLTTKGVTTWDRKGGFAVTHRRIGGLRIMVAILFLIGVTLIYTLESLLRLGIL